MAHSKKSKRGNSRSNSTKTNHTPAVTRSSMTSLASRTSTVEAKAVPNAVTAQAIAEAAYFLWKQRGGNELLNWLEAESMLRRKTAKV